jgi:gliding motility-associated-like protein
MSKRLPRILFYSLFPVLLLYFPLPLQATHQRAAEITFRHLQGLTYELTLRSYTYTPSLANLYRDFLTIDWGDGTVSVIARDTIKYLPDSIQYNHYQGTHSFPGAATYKISCEDPNRNGGIVNIPNSVNVPMYIYSELTINPFLGDYDNSPILLIPPIDNACVDQPFYHNPGAYDPDGDSLSYRLVTCLGAYGQPIPGYTLPPATHSLHLDSITGDLTWDSPPLQGEFNIAILIEEWRDGIRIGSVERDMQIIVVACNNRPPVILALNDTCVEAGKTLTFPIYAFDPDSNQVTLSGTGEPLVLINHPAEIVPNPAVGQGHVSALFAWGTVCDQVRKPPYQVFFKAKDNGSPVNLAYITSMKIEVVGPAPENLTATALGNSITLHWDNYTCPNATGFWIYRKPDSTGWVHAYCETGVPGYTGYVKIDQVDTLGITTYVDSDHGNGLSQGIKYCYLVIAYYPDLALSYASNEACAQLKKDVPVLTNVSVNTTDPATGSLYVAWSKPTELDTIQAPGPYRYVVLRSRSDVPSGFTPVDSMGNLNDTLFTDTLLNTRDYGFTYRIALFNITPGNRFLIGNSQPASSMYLTLSPTDQAMVLNWTANVPWNNDEYVIYRKDPGSELYDSAGASPVNSFWDKGLVNGKSYCYLVKSIGNYSAGGYVNPIINFSQRTCGVPYDNVPPCPPVLADTTLCDQQMNILSWTFPNDSCALDVAGYHIFFTPQMADSLQLIATLNNPKDTTYSHKPDNSIVGCYAITAFDSVGNESPRSDTVCVDVTRCYTYDLPNAFTPNHDTLNEFFRPFPFTSIEKIDLVIIDRWGKRVFETTNPYINWDGTDETTGQPCSDGVYLYVCDVYEITLKGIVKFTLKGSVTILR